MSTMWATVLMGVAGLFQSACGAGGEVTNSEVATSVVSGALNNTTGSTVAWNAPAKQSKLQDILEGLNPIGTAWAASWQCTGASLSPAFNGPNSNPYVFTPMSCAVTWGNGRTASSTWSGTFTLNYGASCDSTHAFIENQAGDCQVTRTTVAGGNTRTVTGPNGHSYSVTHDTNGAGTGWDSSVSPAPTNTGTVATCAAAGCSAGKTLVINGSHLTATTTPVGGSSTTLWNHTVTAAAVTVAGAGTGRVVTGQVTVQHNLAKYTSTTAFSNVTYGDSACCFPTGGSVTTSFNNGPNAGKSESLSFSAVCGEATLTTVSGSTESLTLQHCI